PELAAYLEGQLSLEEARVSTVRQVRQYARRQYTWFRADGRVQWSSPDLELVMARLGVGMMGAETP
ncbi:MAG TPA: tRNA (adenosine(37)-N6)-dimethylallyltransferase MiaA, partial [Candidatus Dormibacteraeota bacterium]|nr:tRNA (adenosine(37)-N6)-dimethylallyltransferase MiaA [Candidatus Dormibacteraeota bacterium]